MNDTSLELFTPDSSAAVYILIAWCDFDCSFDKKTLGIVSQTEWLREADLWFKERRDCKEWGSEDRNLSVGPEEPGEIWETLSQKLKYFFE